MGEGSPGAFGGLDATVRARDDVMFRVRVMREGKCPVELFHHAEPLQ